MQQRTVWGEVEGMVCTRLGGDLSLFISVCVYMYAYESLCFHRRSKVLYSRPVTFLCKEICIQSKPCGEEKALSFSLQQFSDTSPPVWDLRRQERRGLPVVSWPYVGQEEASGA